MDIMKRAEGGKTQLQIGKNGKNLVWFLPICNYEGQRQYNKARELVKGSTSVQSAIITKCDSDFVIRTEGLLIRNTDHVICCTLHFSGKKLKW